MNSEKIKLLEIELIRESKEVDRYDHNLGILFLLSLIPITIDLVLNFKLTRTSDTICLNQINYIIVSSLVLAIYIIFVICLNILILKPAKNRHIAKHELLRQKYKELGIDLAKLDLELINIGIRKKEIKSIEFDVDDETRKKRNFSFFVLSILTLICGVLLYLENFTNKINFNVIAGLLSGFVVAFMTRILDWIEASKIKRNN